MNEKAGRADAESLILDYREGVNRRLEELLPAGEEYPESLHRAMRYAVLGGGKRVRAVLCLAAHRLFGDPYPAAALDAACAVECLHAYTLIHDDLPAIDDDDVRRGKPSCHVAFGESTAILAGDALQALAFEIVSSCRAPSDLVCRAVQLLARTSGSRHLVGGQIADLEGEGQDPTGELVQFIHTRKTAELIATSLTIGAILAGVEDRTLGSVQGIGREIGLAFQIVDDLLDVEGREEIVGKGLRKDAKKGKITYPACYGVDRSRQRAHELITGALNGIRKLGDHGPLQHVFLMIIDRVS
jgi:geranylgeranyl diphosphate synthase type II